MNRYLTTVGGILTVLLASLPMILSAHNFEHLDDGPLACSNQVNVSVNATCGAELTAEALLEGSYDPGTYELQVELTTGVYADLTDVSLHLDERLKYTVTNAGTGQYCWGYIIFEDKTAPVVACTTCDDPIVSDPNCILNCAELPLFNEFDLSSGLRGYDKKLLDNIIPSDPGSFLEDHVSDNCGQTANAYYIDTFDNGDCNSETVMTRSWIVQYGTASGFSGQVICKSYYKFEAIPVVDLSGNSVLGIGDGSEIEDAILLPPTQVSIPLCGNGYSPADIAAYFDDPTTVDYDSDGNGEKPSDGDIDCVIENNEGIWQAYPHIYLPGLKGSDLHATPLTNNLCSVNVSYEDVVIDACGPSCSGNVKISRVWTILDWCSGSYFTHRQIIEVLDMIPPVLDINDVYASVDPWACTATVTIPHPEHLYDLCDDDISYEVQLDGKVIDLSGSPEEGYIIHNLERGAYSLIYTAEDCCGNINKKAVRLFVDDKTPPVPVVKQNLVVDLAPTGIVNVPDRGIAKVYAVDIDNGSYDSCSDVQVYVRRPPGCEKADTTWGEFVRFCCADVEAGGNEIQVEFRVVDWNGNENFTWANILLEDKGVASTCPSDMVLDCNDDIWDYSLTGYPTAQKACEAVIIDIDTIATNERTEPRKKAASVGNVPGYEDVEVEAYDPACGFGAMRREWKSNGITVCTQWFVIEPGINVFDPSTIVFPDNVVADCAGYDTGEPTWLGGSCNLIGLTLNSDTIRVGGEACVKIVNEWAVINWCTYDASDSDLNDVADPDDDGQVRGRFTHFQIIEINDSSAPTIQGFDDIVVSVTSECESKGTWFSAVATDEGDCASPWLAWDIRVDLYDDWQMDYNFTYNTQREINGEPNPFFVEKTASGHAVNILLPDGIEPSKRRHRIDWLVNDGCDNTTLLSTYFTVEDTKAPTPYCLNLGTSVMENGKVELWAIDFNVGSFDHCTDQDNLLFTFTDVPPPPRCDEEFDSPRDLQWYDGSYWFYKATEPTVDDDDDCPLDGQGAYSDGGYNQATRSFEEFGGDIHRWEPALRSSGKIFTTADVGDDQHMEIPIYVWDECDNIDFCIVRLRVIDNGGGAQGLVAGVIKTESGKVVEDVMTEIMTNLPDYPKYQATDNTGSYAFENNVVAMDYQLTASKDGDDLNGVSTIDLIQIQRHILGIETLDSPYKLIAADINNDQRINGQDLVELRKLILGIYTELPQNDSWKIFDQNSTMSLQMPWTIDSEISVPDFYENVMDQDFIGVKVGDVNNSVVANTQEENVTSSKAGLLTYEDQLLEPGQIVDVTFESAAALAGLQIALKATDATVVNVTGAELSEKNYRIEDDKVYLSVNAQEEATHSFEVSLIATRAGLLSEFISLDDSFLSAEVYTLEDFDVLPLQLQPQLNNEFVLYQNTPNPFKEETTISYMLPEASMVKVSFFDMDGRLLHRLDQAGIKGLNQFAVSKEAIGIGLIYYQLETKEYSAVKNMMIIE